MVGAMRRFMRGRLACWLRAGSALPGVGEAVACIDSLEDEASDGVVDWLDVSAIGDGVSWLRAGLFDTAIGVDGATKIFTSMSSKSKGSDIGAVKGA